MSLKIEQKLVTPENAAELEKLCPFGALSYDGKELSVSSACKACKLCVKNGPAGVAVWEEEKKEAVNKDEWRGVCVFAESRDKKPHPVTLELLGKAKELAAVISHPVYALLIGSGMKSVAEELLRYGADRVFVYDDPAYENFTVGPYAAAFTDFIEKIKPSSILVGATNLGRSLAPKVAARVGAGLTADCTILEMKPSTDLVQIRPAFGGNIMAQIVTPDTRPQFCTVRYKIFKRPEKSAPTGEVVAMTTDDAMRKSGTEVLSVERKPREIDISDADVIVAAGRGIKTKDDMALVQELADALGAQLACTRPLIEAGWLDPRRQIGLSGRTVSPKLIITVGVSGSVQFAAGMRGSEYIVAVNSDRRANIFDIAHLGIVGDLYEIVPMLLERIREARNVQ